MRPYSPNEFHAKCKMDVPLFAELFKNYLTESEIPVFQNMLIKTYDLAQQLHEEANVMPQVSMVSLRSKRKLQSLTENENDVSKIVSIIVKSDTDLDPEISKKYGLFEKTIGNSLKDFILPKDTILNMKEYAEGVSPEYFEIFDKNIKTVKAEFNEAVDSLIKNLAIRMFKCGIKLADKDIKIESLNLDNYKGISSLIVDKDELDEVLDKIEVNKPSLDEDELEGMLKS